MNLMREKWKTLNKNLNQIPMEETYERKYTEQKKTEFLEGERRRKV